MAISKERKTQLVEQYTELIKKSSGMVMTSYSGLTVKEMEALRSKIREVGAEFYVVKNTLAEVAFKKAGLTLPESEFVGSTAIGFTSDDLPGLAKAIVDTAKESEAVKVKGGILDGVLYSEQQVKQLAELPTLPVLQSQLIGLIQTPATRIAGAISGSIRQVVNVINAYSESEAASA